MSPHTSAKIRIITFVKQGKIHNLYMSDDEFRVFWLAADVTLFASISWTQKRLSQWAMKKKMYLLPIIAVLLPVGDEITSSCVRRVHRTTHERELNWKWLNFRKVTWLRLNFTRQLIQWAAKLFSRWQNVIRQAATSPITIRPSSSW